MAVGMDEYNRNARLKPALLTIVPAAWTLMVWAPGHELGWGGFWSLFVAAGGTWLLAQMARDRGKQKEAALFESFGGRPTERLLSHRNAPNKVRLAQQHANLRRLFPAIRIPSAKEEAADPAAAHAAYEACTKALIGRSRDDRLLFQENMNFGFRRNLWGLKPYGVAIAAGSAVVLGLRLYAEFSLHRVVPPLVVLFEVLNILLMAAWLFWFTPEWVMIPARAYADRLIDRIDATSISGGDTGRKPRLKN